MGKKRTEVRQQQIVEAARKLIIKFGSEHLTVRKIAKEVGISEAAIYRHFKSKKEILFFLADHIEHSLFEGIDRAAKINGTSLETIDNILKNHLSLIEQKKGTFFQVVAEIISFGDKKLNRKVTESINSYIGHLKSLLSDGIEAGLVKKDIDLEATATLLFGMIQGLVNIWALGNYAFDLTEKYESLWKVFREAVIVEQGSP
ncbi:MAG: TetR/AcrR family transcriptional regulator [Deltaproteobacteria bacterium]|nr:TetR/AcrR family transcriptional regulator [Deltaproteobacteria bacterium]